MDGVLYRGSIVMPQARETLDRLRRAGWRFVCRNRDRAYPVEGRVLPGAGSIVAAVEIATGQQALCIGKPEPFLFEEALRRAGWTRGAGEPAIVVGDSTDYDIVAAH